MNNRYENTTNPSINIDKQASTSDCVYRTNKSYIEPCPYRLPCGYCKELMRDCPKYYTMTWTSGNPNIKVTC